MTGYQIILKIVLNSGKIINRFASFQRKGRSENSPDLVCEGLMSVGHGPSRELGGICSVLSSIAAMVATSFSIMFVLFLVRRIGTIGMLQSIWSGLRVELSAMVFVGGVVMRRSMTESLAKPMNRVQVRTPQLLEI